MGECFIGVDVGTSGCRAVAIDPAGAALAESTLPMAPPLRSADGASTQEPSVWWGALTRCLRDLGERIRGLPPRALCLDATATSLLLADRDGNPLGPAMMYDDRRATEQARRVAAVSPDHSPARGANASLAKLLYLMEQLDPPDGTLALHQADWLLGGLCARHGVSDWNNSLRLGFDPQAERWPDWLQRLPLRTLTLPQVRPPGALLGTLSPDSARLTGLPVGLAVHCGTTDSTASVLAAGVSQPGDGVTVLGSTLVVKLLSSDPLSDPALGVYSHRIGDLWLTGGASNSGGAVLRRFFDDQVIERLSAAMNPDRPTGLDYYPLLRPGERFPCNDPDFAPRLEPRPARDELFLQGMLEGMAAIEASGYRLLGELGAPRLRRVVSIGGGAGNPQWRRIRERLLGVPVTTARHQQAAYGAALLALRGQRE